MGQPRVVICTRHLEKDVEDVWRLETKGTEGRPVKKRRLFKLAGCR